MKGICNPEETIEEFQDRYVSPALGIISQTDGGTGNWMLHPNAFKT